MKLLPTLLALAAFTAAAAAEERPLFNGKDLTGWEGNPRLWSVQDGAITGKTGEDAETKLKHNTFLVWRGGTVGDFELSFKYRIVKGNSGVQYRSRELEKGEFGPILSGYQADFEAGKTYSGILYEERGRAILARRGEKTVIKPNAENPKKPVVEVVKIVAQGNHLQHFINGRQTVDVTDEDSANAAKEGLLALQIHQGPPMVVQYKDIVLKTK
jgi:hypothetical protein